MSVAPKKGGDMKKLPGEVPKPGKRLDQSIKQFYEIGRGTKGDTGGWGRGW